MTNIPEYPPEANAPLPADAPAQKAPRSWLILNNPTVCCLLVFLFPFVIGLANPQKGRAIRYLAGDVYYYLVVARNYLDYGLLSFDGEYPTNGFHPLWQCCVIMITAIGDLLGLSKYDLCTLTLLWSIVLVALTLLLLAACVRRALGFIPWAFCLLPLGVCGALGFLGLPWLHLSLWSYADGMESSLVLLAYACFLYLGLSKKFMESPANAIGVGCSLALLALARLDHALFLVPFSLIVVWRYWTRPSQNTLLYLTAVIIPSVALVGYMGFNVYYAGSPLPVSGAYKSSFPYFYEGNFATIKSAFRYLVAPDHGYYVFRMIQIFVPAATAIGVLLLLISRRFREKSYSRVLGFTAAGILLLALYNALYVKIIDHGHWYFPVSVLFVSLVALLCFCESSANRQIRRPGTFWLPALSLTIVVCAGLFFAKTGNRSDYFNKAFVASEAVQQHYAGQQLRFIAYDDGIIAFVTEQHVLSGSRLVIDREAYKHLTLGRAPFLQIALERGYNRVVATVNCVDGSLEEMIHGMQEGDRLDPQRLTPFGGFIFDLNQYAAVSSVAIYLEFISAAQDAIVLRLEPAQDVN